MNLQAKYSFNAGENYVQQHYPRLYEEVLKCIRSVDKSTCLTKSSNEKTMVGKQLYSPRALNACFKQELVNYGWKSHRVQCDYSSVHYLGNYTAEKLPKRPFREMDFVKDKLGVEVQFGKYSFMVYNVCAKMTIFRNLGVIDAGIEIVPIRELTKSMSTGVSFFEQFAWDLEQRGVADIDIPVLILGIG